MCVAGAVLVIAISAASIEYLTRFASRANYIVLFGTALLLPALIRLVVRRFSEQPVAGTILYLSSLLATALLDLRFVHNRALTFDPAILIHRSWSLHVMVAAGYLMLVVLLVGGALRHARRWPKRKRLLPSPLQFILFSAPLSAILAFLAVAGALFHYRVKEAYVTRGDQTLRVYEQLRVLAPALQDGTFVVLMTPDPGRREGAYYEVSNFLRVLYDNPTLSGNLYGKVYYTADGALSKGWDWDDLAKVSYDRLLLVHDDGELVSLPGKMNGRRVDGGMIEVHSDLTRILDQDPKPSPAWNHIRH